MDKTKQLAIIVRSIGYAGQIVANALDVSSIPAMPSTVKYALETTITKAVAEPTITVSTNGCSMDIKA